MYREIKNYDEKAEAILSLVKEMSQKEKHPNLSNAEIGALFGVSTATVWRIRKSQGRIATKENIPEEDTYYVNNLILKHWPATDPEVTREYLESKGIYHVP